MEQRSLLLFQNCIKSKESVKSSVYYLDRFIPFYHLKYYDSLAGMNPLQLPIMVEDYVMDLKKNVNPNSVLTHYSPIQTFLEANDIDLKWKKIKKLFPAKIKSTVGDAYTIGDIAIMLKVVPQLRNLTIIHFLVSTGCRIGAILTQVWQSYRDAMGAIL